MISIAFDYSKYPKNRTLMLQWVRMNNGLVIRDEPKKFLYLGKILSIEFECEEDAILFKLKFGL